MRRPVVFDLDGVLIDSEPLYERAFRDFLAELGRGNPSELFPITLGRREVDFLPVVAERLGLSESEARRGLERATSAVLGELEPMPAASEVVSSLHTEGRNVAVATSSLATFAEHAVRRLGIESMLKALVTGEDVTDGKPDPAIYRLAASRIGVDPRTCIAIEDTPAGVAAATGAGMTCIAIPHALSPSELLGDADLIAPDLRAAASAIDHL